MDLPLAVAARELSLTKDAGSTHVLVYSNGDWTARFTRNVKWASLNKLQGYGNNEIVFTYSANYGISRKVGVVFEKGELTDTVMFTPSGHRHRTVARVRQTRRSAVEGAVANLRRSTPTCGTASTTWEASGSPTTMRTECLLEPFVPRRDARRKLSEEGKQYSNRKDRSPALRPDGEVAITARGLDLPLAVSAREDQGCRLDARAGLLERRLDGADHASREVGLLTKLGIRQ